MTPPRCAPTGRRTRGGPVLPPFRAPRRSRAPTVLPDRRTGRRVAPLASRPPPLTATPMLGLVPRQATRGQTEEIEKGSEAGGATLRLPRPAPRSGDRRVCPRDPSSRSAAGARRTGASRVTKPSYQSFRSTRVARGRATATTCPRGCLGPERRRGSRPGQRDCPTGAPRAPRSTQRRLVGGLCRLGLRGARGAPNPRGTARNRGHRNAVVRARTMPNLQAFHGEESAHADSLKIVVSPVRVRVSPSEEMPAGPATARRPWPDGGRGVLPGSHGSRVDPSPALRAARSGAVVDSSEREYCG